MTKLTNIATFAVILILSSCGNPQSEIRDAFETVNNSIDVSRGISERSADSIYKSISTNTKASAELKSKADSIYYSARAAHLLIENLKSRLLQIDSVGDSLELANRIIRQSKAGDSLLATLLSVRKTSYSSLVDPSLKPRLDTILEDIGELPKSDWQKTYFEQIPTIGAVTILSKFDNDCRDAALTSLKSIRSAITK